MAAQTRKGANASVARGESQKQVASLSDKTWLLKACEGWDTQHPITKLEGCQWSKSVLLCSRLFHRIAFHESQPQLTRPTIVGSWFFPPTIQRLLEEPARSRSPVRCCCDNVNRKEGIGVKTTHKAS